MAERRSVVAVGARQRGAPPHQDKETLMENAGAPRATADTMRSARLHADLPPNLP